MEDLFDISNEAYSAMPIEFINGLDSAAIINDAVPTEQPEVEVMTGHIISSQDSDDDDLCLPVLPIESTGDQTIAYGHRQASVSEIKLAVPAIAQGLLVVDELRLAEAELLGHVIDLIRPALPGIVSRMAVACKDRNFIWHSQRGLVISSLPDDAGPAIIRPNRSVEQGIYTGHEGILLEDGSLQVLQYHGTWDPSNRSEWVADITNVTPMELFKCLGISVDRILEVILAALQRDRTQRLGGLVSCQSRIAKIRAVLMLLSEG